MPVITHETVDSVFSYHQPKEDQAERYIAIRDVAKLLAKEILQLCPESPERTLALRDVQRAVMMANASIALNE